MHIIWVLLELAPDKLNNLARKLSARGGEAVAEAISIEMAVGNEDRCLFVPHAKIFTIVNGRVGTRALVSTLTRARNGACRSRAGNSSGRQTHRTDDQIKIVRPEPPAPRFIGDLPDFRDFGERAHHRRA